MNVIITHYLYILLMFFGFHSMIVSPAGSTWLVLCMVSGLSFDNG